MSTPDSHGVQIPPASVDDDPFGMLARDGHRPTPCAVCCRDWQAGRTTVLCRTCLAVDALLAARAGAVHFLPHVVARTLSSQPESVMACALHSARFPHDTGFYGVYTTMSGILKRVGRERRHATGRALIDATSRDSEHGLESWLEPPTHEYSLAAIQQVVTAHMKPAATWLNEQVVWARTECARLDEQQPQFVSDYESARLIAALARDLGINPIGEHA